MTTVLVTGGAGFIGSNLTKALLEKGYTVVCFDNLSTGRKENIEEFQKKENKYHKNYFFEKGDVNTKDIEHVFERYKFDYVFHHAAVVGVKRTEENPLAVLNDVEGIKKILELSKKHGVKKAVYASSSEVYGNPVEIPEREDGVVNPHIPYAVVKLLGEKLFESYYKVHGLRTTCLRLFNVYGPKQNSTPYGFVVAIFTRQAMNKEDITVFGDGSQTRDFVFVEDNVAATIAAMESTKTDGMTINVGTGKETSVLELAKTVAKICKRDLSSIKYFPERSGEIPRRLPSTDRMRKLIGFTPKHTLEQGLKKTIEYYK